MGTKSMTEENNRRAGRVEKQKRQGVFG